MKFKSGVRIYKFMKTPVMWILQVVQDTAPEGYEPTVTSANDSRHGEGSLHYKDAAFDIRVIDYPGFDLARFEATRHVIDEWIGRMRRQLSKRQYDIVFGDPWHKNHIHIEWDPDPSTLRQAQGRLRAGSG